MLPSFLSDLGFEASDFSMLSTELALASLLPEDTEVDRNAITTCYLTDMTPEPMIYYFNKNGDFLFKRVLRVEEVVPEDTISSIGDGSPDEEKYIGKSAKALKGIRIGLVASIFGIIFLCVGTFLFILLKGV